MLILFRKLIYIMQKEMQHLNTVIDIVIAVCLHLDTERHLNVCNMWHGKNQQNV